MSFLSRIFGIKRTIPQKKAEVSLHVQNPKINEIFELNDFINKLLSSDSYIAKSDYLKRIDSTKNVVHYFQQLKNDNLLIDFCKKNSISDTDLLSVIQKYSSIRDLVSNHNESYIAQKLETEKGYLDSILHNIDPNIMLDDDQRRVVLTDEDYCLVIAGAGAGKTTTVAAKVKYLVEKKNIDPRKILVVSFTNKAVGELREKLTSNSILIVQ